MASSRAGLRRHRHRLDMLVLLVDVGIDQLAQRLDEKAGGRSELADLAAGIRQKERLQRDPGLALVAAYPLDLIGLAGFGQAEDGGNIGRARTVPG